MLKAAECVKVVESRQGYLIASPEKIAFHRRFIGASKLRDLGEALSKTAYGQYLVSVADTVVKEET